ncbi:MAG TPA: ROK family protein [Caldilineaceae bacterium]|nr:ROK family protein [Caldilineaceae bacterium]
MRSLIGQPELLKDLNRARTLELLFQNRVLSRPQLAKETGLSRATIAILVDELLTAGLVRERGLGDSGGGRPPVLLEFNPGAALALGARLRDHRWGLVLTNLDAQVVARLDVPLADLSPATAIAALRQGVAQITAGIERKRLLPAIGLGTPGLVDMASGVVKTAVDVGWFDVPIGQMAEAALGVPVYVANRSKVGALAELWCGREQNVQNLIYISIGTGIAAGIVTQGQLYRGVNSSAGELGHITVLPDGPLCGCGNRGCLQALASGPAIANRAREQLRLAPASLLADLVEGHPERITAETVFGAAAAGDPLALQVVNDTAAYLGIAVANLVNLFNPELIVLGGPVGQNGQILLEPVRSEAQRRAMAYPFSAVRIVTSTLGPDAGAIGAAVLVLQRTSELFFARG